MGGELDGDAGGLGGLLDLYQIKTAARLGWREIRCRYLCQQRQYKGDRIAHEDADWGSVTVTLQLSCSASATMMPAGPRT